MRRLLSALLTVLALAAACGDGDDGGTAPGGETGPTTAATDGGETSSLQLTAEDVAFDKAALTAPAGPVSIRFANRDDGVSHNLHVTGNGVDDKTQIEPGPVTQDLELDLDAGTYSYMCDVHPQMKGELTVT